MSTVSIAIPQRLSKQVDAHRRQLGISTRDYVTRALARFMQTTSADFYRENGFDVSLSEEMAEWDRISSDDFAAFAAKHKL